MIKNQQMLVKNGSAISRQTAQASLKQKKKRKRAQGKHSATLRLEKHDEICSFDWNKTAITFWFFKISPLKSFSFPWKRI